MIRQIESIARIGGQVHLPGSKSVTHRALLIAALADGESRIRNPLRAEDTLLTAQALEQLGVELLWEQDAVRVRPPKLRWSEPAAPVQLGNSGTSMRLLAGFLAAGRGRFVLDGTDRLRERPIGPVLEGLAEQGVRGHFLGQGGYPPVEMVTTGLQGGEIEIDARQSSQFLSSILVVAPCAPRDMVVSWMEPVASLPYVHLTLAMLEQWGVTYHWLGSNRVRIPAPQVYRAQDYLVEGDCSSASYWWAAAAITGGEIVTAPVTSEALQGDCRFLEVLERMGCTIHWGEKSVRVQGPERLNALDLDMNAMPDMVPTLAVVAAFAEGTTRIHNVAHLRIKESDRIAVVAMELSKLGVVVKELPDGLVIRGGGARGAAIESHNDHRIAMAFAIAGLRIPGLTIHGAEAVAKSYPTFWEEFTRVAHEPQERPGLPLCHALA
ncbi:MAG TPA: 3-phosphoshikimate 1-carboxyvinyltransferase [Syntrophobacteraceae bacterium]|nr:3-phosphoshikimate 1-carboxyvinyltransferase [Syntrophobacteraceae bacterium]